ncbi:unnamed protein product [Anisakis simplex]|uniref:CDK-activating kinase assembly factor MAT1 (inferred by orthology to a human protein) n=1 Tax=Anisakis simplex TaxID=6269 RepID=A0A0M3IYF6_ANISI|nr:unnamed protein product [Anisakis simplex]
MLVIRKYFSLNFIGDPEQFREEMRECPKCRTKEYTNRSMVMMINDCGHPLCRNCVESLFARNSGPCPQCGKILWKKGFWEQIFDDPVIEKENSIRRRLKKIYNLKRENFPSLREYNDYLERIETMVMNLAHDIDVEETEAEISRFKSENAELLERNKKKLDEDQLWIRQMLDEERLSKQRTVERFRAETATQKAATGTSARAIINELKDSDLPAEVILDRQRKKLIEAELAEKEETARMKKKKFESQKQTASFVSLNITGAPFVYHAPELPLNGPPLPDAEVLSQMGYLQHIRSVSSTRLAGGYTAETGCMRALFESRIDLFNF